MLFLSSCIQQAPAPPAEIPEAPLPSPTSSPITILSDTVLTADLSFDSGGIIIGADNIMLDLGGHTITGPGKGPWIWPEPALSSVGIQLTDRKGITIKNGQVRDFATGLLIENSEGTVVQDVTTSSNHYGIYLWSSGGNHLMRNNITSNVYGLHLMGARENRITENHVFQNHHGSPGGYGINLIASSKNILTENTIDSNQSQGIWLIKCLDNLIYHNSVMGNHPNAVDESGTNLWHDPASKEGNYWDDYTGEDADSNGIGEVPYQFYEQGQDPYPFIRIDGWVR
jgi:parallel beta-helix repeat protein